MKDQLKKIVGESAVIIFSVFLALFANEWRNKVNEDNQTQIILSNIKAELRDNERIAKNAISYHQSVFDHINNLEWSDSLENALFNGYFFDDFKLAPKGIMRESFNDIAWIVAQEERLATRISFQESEAIYEAYNQQETVDHTINRIINLLFDRTTHQKASIKSNVVMLQLLFFELTAQEEELMRKYARVWKMIGAPESEEASTPKESQ